MAVAGSCRVWAAVAAVLALAAVVGASTLEVYERSPCVGNYFILKNCGSCQKILYNGCYYFDYTGAVATLYETDECSGSSFELTESTTHSDEFLYKGVNISCSSTTSKPTVAAAIELQPLSTYLQTPGTI